MFLHHLLPISFETLTHITHFISLVLFVFILIVLIKFALSNKTILLMRVINFTMYHLKSILNLVEKRKAQKKINIWECVLVKYLLCDIFVWVCISIYISICLPEIPWRCWQYNYWKCFSCFMYNIIYCIFRMKPFQSLCNYFII